MYKAVYGNNKYQLPDNPVWLNVEPAMQYFSMSRNTLMRYARLYGALAQVGRTNKINVPKMNEGLLSNAGR